MHRQIAWKAAHQVFRLMVITGLLTLVTSVAFWCVMLKYQTSVSANLILVWHQCLGSSSLTLLQPRTFWRQKKRSRLYNASKSIKLVSRISNGNASSKLLRLICITVSWRSLADSLRHSAIPRSGSWPLLLQSRKHHIVSPLHFFSLISYLLGTLWTRYITPLLTLNDRWRISYHKLTNQRQLIISQFGYNPIQTTLLGCVDGAVESKLAYISHIVLIPMVSNLSIFFSIDYMARCDFGLIQGYGTWICWGPDVCPRFPWIHPCQHLEVT